MDQNVRTREQHATRTPWWQRLESFHWLLIASAAAVALWVGHLVMTGPPLPDCPEGQNGALVDGDRSILAEILAPQGTWECVPIGTDTRDASNEDHAAQPEEPKLSSGDALEAYVELARPAFEAEVASYSGVYRKIDLVAVAPNTMYYIYTYRDYVDAGQVQAHLASQDATLDGLARTIKPELRQAGVKNPKINWVYLNSDGSHIASVEK